MAPHSSTLAWKIPWTEEPGGLPSMGSQSRTRLKRLSMHACMLPGYQIFKIHLFLSFKKNLVLFLRDPHFVI